MNPELLKKCLAGNASDSEWETYLNWIDGKTPEDDLEETISHEQLVKTRILNKVITKNKQHTLHRHRKTFALITGIAASLIGILYCSFLFHSGHQFKQTQVYKYASGAENSENNFNGIIVKLAQNSEISLNQRTNTNINLHFLGSVMLSNKSAKDQNITIKHNRDGIKKVCLRKGHSYFLSYLNFKYQEVIMVDQQSMNDIPPALAMNMQQQFNL